MLRKFLASVFLMFFPAVTSFAAHPLVTDDTGTQGKGKFQLEVNSEFTYEKETEAGVTKKETGTQVATALSYGVTDNVDVVLGMPNQWKKSSEDSAVTSDASGVSDMSIEVKWRFFDKEGLSFDLKPGITLPTGDENKGLGSGRTSYSLTIITTKKIEPWAFHLNLKDTVNEYKLRADKDSKRRDIWHISLASEVEIIKDLRVVGNVGVERNQDKTKRTHPAFILGGVIYSISEDFDIDIGIKGGLNKPATDYSILAGITLRF